MNKIPRKKLAIGAVLTIISGVIIDSLILNHLYNCVGIGGESTCTSAQLTMSHIITHAIVLVTYAALVVLGITLISWRFDKFKRK